ncbi:MAG TPA: hypothetical protein QF800_00115 [Phycisphaerales bacterium]|jgi:phospholipase/carboxylesterase|nr:hypothetical protein [Phycisphaerales bacterium]
MDKPLNIITVPPKQQSPVVRPLVLLHGYGANAQDLLGLRDAVAPDRTAIAIEAPIDLGPMGMPGGFAWFHIMPGESGELQYDPASAIEAAAMLQDAISTSVQACGGRIEDTVVMGFSQGAMLGHAMLLNAKIPMQGLAACSGRMVPELFGSDSPPPVGTPVFLSHGTLDELIPFSSGQAIATFYNEHTETNVTWCEETVGHGIGPVTVSSLASWFIDLSTAST